MEKEFFGPLLAVHVYDDAADADGAWDKVLHQVDSTSEYALTCSIFAQRPGRDRDRAGPAARHRRHDLRQRQAHRRPDRPAGFGGGRGSGTNDKVGSPLALQRWVNARFVKENFAPPTTGPTRTWAGRESVPVRRRRGRPGRRRHRVEPRPPRPRGDAGGADPARRAATAAPTARPASSATPTPTPSTSDSWWRRRRASTSWSGSVTLSRRVRDAG